MFCDNHSKKTVNDYIIRFISCSMSTEREKKKKTETEGNQGISGTISEFRKFGNQQVEQEPRVKVGNREENREPRETRKFWEPLGTRVEKAALEGATGSLPVLPLLDLSLGVFRKRVRGPCFL